MKWYQKYSFIQKALTQNGNSTKKIALTTIFSVSIIFLVLFVLNGNEMTSIEQLYQTYGTYTVTIPKDDNTDYEGLYNDNCLKNYWEIGKDEYEENGNSIIKYNADENFIKYSNVSLIEGKYPEKSNEIAVERRFLFSLGVKSEEMIGKKISCQNKEYLVTGIVIQYSAFDELDEQNPYIYVTNDKTISPNTVMLQLRDIRNYESDLDSLSEKYNIDDGHCYVNIDLFTALGYTTGENTFENNKYLYYMIFFIILLVVFHTLNNYIQIWNNNVKESVRIMNYLGISCKLIRKSLILYYIRLIIKNILLGIVISIGLSCIIYKKMFYTLSAKQIVYNFPYKIFGISILIFCILIFGETIWITREIEKIDILYKKINKHKKTEKFLFSEKVKNYNWIVYRKNIRQSRIHVIASIIGVALTVLIFSVGSCFMTSNVEAFGHNTNMDYKVSFNPKYMIEDENLAEQEKIFNELSNMKKDCIVWPSYINKKRISLPKNKLDKKYINYLEDLSSNGIFDKDMILLDVTIVGYNEYQLQQLYEENNLEYSELKDNEAIVLSHTLPLRGREGFSHQIKEGDSLAFDNQAKDKVVIKEVVNKIPVELSEGYNTICIFVSENRFRTDNEINIPESFFLKSLNHEGKANIESIILGNVLFEITIPKEEEKLIDDSMYLLKGITYTLFFLIVLCIINSIYSNIILRYQIQKKEYGILHLIGVSWKDNRKVLVYEIVEILFGGVLVSIPFVAIITYIMQAVMLGEIGKYMYCFPIKDYVIIGIVFLVSSYIISTGLAKYIINDSYSGCN